MRHCLRGCSPLLPAAATLTSACVCTVSMRLWSCMCGHCRYLVRGHASLPPSTCPCTCQAAGTMMSRSCASLRRLLVGGAAEGGVACRLLGPNGAGKSTCINVVRCQPHLSPTPLPRVVLIFSCMLCAAQGRAATPPHRRCSGHRSSVSGAHAQCCALHSSHLRRAPLYAPARPRARNRCL